ncbi:hypothetical protein ACQUWN_19520 [Rossellomorea aquimaris]|uniref:hypothetical protein n=1 Tax=Rossellomorea TaxID=2837508 RepID=UPI001653CF4F|nr:hypothetical protein [Rossellomorea vietnamensis]
MNQEKLELLLKVVSGLKKSEWNRLVQKVDLLYSSKADKVEFDDLELLEKNIKREFRNI